MLISHLSESEAAEAKGVVAVESDEYQTTGELFELLSKNHSFHPNRENDSLATRDLFFMYKTINLDTNPESENSEDEFKNKTSNQYVETIVEELDSESDMSEVYSTEDLHNVILVNKERVDFLSDPPLENILCHKLDQVKRPAPERSVDYDRQLIFNDPFINEQLKGLNLTSPECMAYMIPTTLLDYICCKHLEDNYNFYMENIIKYVNHTIDQLKRISNGEFLTEKAKRKWLEVETEINAEKYQLSNNCKNTTVLATSTRIPLHVESKTNGQASLWDDIVHSGVDLKYLSRILEKKIVVEVPKTLCGTFKLFSNCYNDDLIVRCKKKEAVQEEERLDVVVKLKRSGSGHVVSNIRSIMFLQTKPAYGHCVSDVLPLPSSEVKNKYSTLEQRHRDSNKIKIQLHDIIKQTEEASLPENLKRDSINMDEDDALIDTEHKKLEGDENSFSSFSYEDIYNSGDSLKHTCTDTIGLGFYQDDTSLGREEDSPDLSKSVDSSEESLKHITKITYTESSDSEPVELSISPGYNCDPSWETPEKDLALDVPYKLLPANELRMTIQRLHMQDSLLEDPAEGYTSPCKKKSPLRIRIKSPYENKSHVLEEKKRKKLLEIRQRREKKKNALTESCKIVSKTKYGKKAVMQTSSSVTKLSITNKSFYDSIYGQNLPETKLLGQPKMPKNQKDSSAETGSDVEVGNHSCATTMNEEKYTNKAHGLGEVMTDKMHIKMTKSKKHRLNCILVSETTTSVASNDLSPNLNLLSQLMSRKLDKQTDGQTERTEAQQSYNRATAKEDNLLMESPNERKRSPKRYVAESEFKKKCPPADFRKNIDRIYDLINSQKERNETKHSKHTKAKPHTRLEKRNAIGGDIKSSTSQCTDSGTSLKHRTSSNHSCFSFCKINDVHTDEPKNPKAKQNHKSNSPVVVPKLMLTSKSQIPKFDKNKTRRLSPLRLPENPLKAISQLLQEFDNVQKKRIKNAEKLKKSAEIPRSVIKKPKEIDSHAAVRHITIRDRKMKPCPSPVETVKHPQHIQAEERQIRIRIPRNQVADIVDEYKEARGEAVRGPPKYFSSRLDTLAQPKKHYVQARFEQFQQRFEKGFHTEKLRKPVTPPTPLPKPKMPPVYNSKLRFGKQVAPQEKFSRFKSADCNTDLTLGPNASRCHDNEGNPPNKNAIIEVEIKPGGRSRPAFDILKEHQLKKRIDSESSIHGGASSTTEEESSKIAKELHTMIDSIVQPPPPSLESNKSYFKIIDSNAEDTPLLDFCDKACQEESGSKNTTEENTSTPIQGSNSNNITSDSVAVLVKPYNSLTEITRMCAQMAEQVALTPKQSLQHVRLLQSRDSSSIATRQLNFERSISKTLDLKVVSEIKKSAFDWTFTQIPMQVTTVGYSFPKYYVDPKVFSRIAKSNATRGTCDTDSPTGSECSWFPLHKSCQCFTSNTSILPKETKGNSECLVTKIRAPEKILMVNRTIQESITCNKTIQGQVEHGYEDKTASSDAIGSSGNSNSVILSSFVSTHVKASNNMGLISDMLIPETLSENVESIGAEAEIPNETPLSNPATTSQSSVKQPECDLSCIDEKSEDNLQQTTSLDILVGLLNEIKNITTCQTQIYDTHSNTVDHQTSYSCKKDEEELINSVVSDVKHTKTSTYPTNTYDDVSISSLDKMRHLESDPSIYSYLLSSDGDRGHVENMIADSFDVYETLNHPAKPDCADKEVTAELPEKQRLVSEYTNVPSIMFPVSLNDVSTMMSSSVVGIISKPSTQSLFSIGNRSGGRSLTLTENENIIEMQMTPDDEGTPFKVTFQKKPRITNKSVTKSDKLAKKPKLTRADKCSKLLTQNYFASEDFDSTMKMKRDILVTVYSLLVFTVFAALSFPRVLYC